LSNRVKWTECNFKICSINISSGCYPPTATNCEFDGTSYTLSWANAQNASSYEVEITNIYGHCCEDPGFPYENIISTTSNSVTIQNIECFSWRVRSNCGKGEGINSSWTSFECGCPFPVGKGANGGAKLFISPNPAKDVLKVKVENMDNETELIIIDGSGAQQLKSTIGKNEQKTIDISKLKPGLYICKVLYDGAVLTSEKLIVN